jgi:hypothetical protein
MERFIDLAVEQFARDHTEPETDNRNEVFSKFSPSNIGGQRLPVQIH